MSDARHKQGSQRWQTPPEVFQPLMEEFKFDLDAAADSLTKRVTPFLEDALSEKPWAGSRIWLNPPYGDLMNKFILRAAQEADLGKLVVGLLPFRCNKAWHAGIFGRASEIRCIPKRIKFVGLDGTRPKFTSLCDSCVVIWTGGINNTRIVSA